jgi:hypothetical protein
MSPSQKQLDERAPHEPAKQPYTPPLLTRCGTVEELTGTPTDGTTTGSGIYA